MSIQTARQLQTDDIQWCRDQFPALQRQVDGSTAMYLDGPAGTQVPQSVIDAISHALAHTNANHGGLFATSRESDQMLDEAHRAAADLLGVEDADTVAFGPNMTTLCMALSRSLAKTIEEPSGENRAPPMNAPSPSRRTRSSPVVRASACQ